MVILKQEINLKNYTKASILFMINLIIQLLESSYWSPQGFIYFDERFKGKPLVFVGTVGLIPKEDRDVPDIGM